MRGHRSSGFCHVEIKTAPPLSLLHPCRRITASIY
nr:MAG TPA: hypothetical protein [Caudoviricetes sp.]